MKKQHENESQLDLRTEEVQEILSEPPHFLVKWGITILFFMIISMISCTFFISYPDIIETKVLVTTKTPVEKIRSNSSGYLQKLLVKDLQKINSGKIIGIMNNNAVFEDVLFLKHILDSTPNIASSFNFPLTEVRQLDLGEIQEDYAYFERIYTDYFLSKNLDQFQTETTYGTARLKELESQLVSMERNLDLEKEKLEIIRKDLERNKILYKKDVISMVELEQKKLQLWEAEKNYENLNLGISQLYESKADINKGLQNSDISEKKLDTQYLRDLLLAYKQLKTSLSLWEQKYLLQSNTDGVISFNRTWTDNQYINSGEEIISVVPQNSAIIGKILAPPTNIGKVKENLKVQIKLDNYPYQQFGMLLGKVNNISLTPNENSSYYIELIIPDLITTYKQEIVFERELIGTANIITEDLRLIDRIFYQFRNIFS